MNQYRKRYIQFDSHKDDPVMKVLIDHYDKYENEFDCDFNYIWRNMNFIWNMIALMKKGLN